MDRKNAGLQPPAISFRNGQFQRCFAVRMKTTPGHANRKLSGFALGKKTSHLYVVRGLRYDENKTYKAATSLVTVVEKTH
jgi:hypothetical protein